MSLSNKIIFVIGGAGGIGSAVCKRFAEDNFQVIVGDINLPEADRVCNALNTNDRKLKHISLYLNVRDYRSLENAFETAYAAYKAAPAMVVIASGSYESSLVLNMSERTFTDIVDLNLTGVFRATKLAAWYMVKHQVKNGCIVNLSSIAYKYPNLENSNFCAASAGLEAFTRVAGKELAEHGIRVVSVATGVVETKMLGNMTEELREELVDAVALKRIATPKEIAGIIHFLSTPDSGYLTACAIEVSGGYTA